MKVQLGIRIQPSTYFDLNLDCAAQPNENDRILVDPLKLDEIIDNNECTNLNVNDTADYLPLRARQTALLHWGAKVAHNGQLVLSGTDLYEASRLIFQGDNIDLNQANDILYGIGRKSLAIPGVNTQILTQGGQFLVESLSWTGFSYVMIFRRK